MKCKECENFLEEYMDGELDARARARVETHLAACAACERAYESLLSEQALYASYERGVEVTPRMWGGVEARIGALRIGGEVGLLRRISGWFAPLLTAPRFSPALTAALVVVAVGLTVGVMKLTGSRSQTGGEVAMRGEHDQLNVNAATPRTPQPHSNPAPTSIETTTPAATSTPAPSASPTATPEEKAPQLEKRKRPSREQRHVVLPTLDGGASVQQAAIRKEQTPEQLVREAEQRYVAAIRMLQRDVASRRSQLDAQTVARFDETLVAIDRSIAETRRSVRAHADDPVAVQYMLSAYAKKVEVLRELARLQQ